MWLKKTNLNQLTFQGEVEEHKKNQDYLILDGDFKRNGKSTYKYEEKIVDY